MITNEEKIEIINLAVEKALLLIPEIVGNMITNHITLNKMNAEFYQKYPEFKGKGDVVTSVMEMVEGKNTNLPYDKLLEKAVPLIRERIKITQGLNLTNISKPSRDFSQLQIEESNNGYI